MSAITDRPPWLEEKHEPPLQPTFTDYNSTWVENRKLLPTTSLLRETLKHLEAAILSSVFGPQVDTFITAYNDIKEKINRENIDLEADGRTGKMQVPVSSDTKKKNGLIRMKRSELYKRTSAAKFFKGDHKFEHMICDDNVMVDPKTWTIMEPAYVLFDHSDRQIGLDYIKRKLEELQSQKNTVFPGTIIDDAPKTGNWRPYISGKSTVTYDINKHVKPIIS